MRVVYDPDFKSSSKSSVPILTIHSKHAISLRAAIREVRNAYPGVITRRHHKDYKLFIGDLEVKELSHEAVYSVTLNGITVAFINYFDNLERQYIVRRWLRP